MKPLICFIDDSADERRIFEQVFGGDDSPYRLISASRFDEAVLSIGQLGEIPALFVLDLYLPVDPNATPNPVPLVGKIDLPDDGGDLIKAFMNLKVVEDRYQEIRKAQGQSPEGGFKLIKQVRETYPGVPAVTFTRKGTIEDAETALRLGVRKVVQKPSGNDWDAALKAARDRRNELKDSFQAAIKIDPLEVLNFCKHLYALRHPDSNSNVFTEFRRVRRDLIENKNIVHDLGLLIQRSGDDLIQSLLEYLYRGLTREDQTDEK